MPRLPMLWQLLILFNFGANIARSYWLMGASEYWVRSIKERLTENCSCPLTDNVLTTQRIDPIVNPGIVGPHVHDSTLHD